MKSAEIAGLGIWAEKADSIDFALNLMQLDVEIKSNAILLLAPL